MQEVAGVLPVGVQVKPRMVSVQSMVHPLLSVASPSSQVSQPYNSPSPQSGMQVEIPLVVVLDQSQPVSIVQVLLHPSPLTSFPSSHASKWATGSNRPFPQASLLIDTPFAANCLSYS